MRVKPILLLIVFSYLFLVSNSAQAKQVGKVSGELWFVHDWKLRDSRSIVPTRMYPPIHIQVRIDKLPPKTKLGPPRAILNFFNRGSLIYSSNSNEDREPIHIACLDDEKLAVLWCGPGPNFTIDVFTFRNGKIHLALETGSKSYPEIVFPTSAIRKTSYKGKDKLEPVALDPQVITLSTNDLVAGKQVPSRAFVWVWDKNENRYKETTENSIEWSERFTTNP